MSGNGAAARTRSLKRLAIDLSVQLPNDPDEAIAVIDHMRRVVTEYWNGDEKRRPDLAVVRPSAAQP